MRISLNEGGPQVLNQSNHGPLQSLRAVAYLCGGNFIQIPTYGDLPAHQWNCPSSSSCGSRNAKMQVVWSSPLAECDYRGGRLV